MTLSDLAQLSEFAPDFPMPDIGNRLYVMQEVTRGEDGKIQAGALVKVTSELILIVDPKLSRLKRARVFRNFMVRVRDELRARGLDDTHAFVMGEQPEHTAKVLKKHFGFEDATGIPLYKGGI